MKVRAVRPKCQRRIPNWWVIKWLPHVHYSCPQCHAKIRANSIWEWIGDLCLGSPLGFAWFAAWIGIIRWPAALACTLAVFAAAWFAFPYITPFDAVGDPGKEDVQPRAGV